MATISVPNVRVNSDIRFKVTLSDNDVAVDWSSVEELAVILYFRDQRTFGARCTIDDIDGTDLHISYLADRPQFLGIADIVVNCVYQGFEKTFDKPAVNFVDSTAAASGVTNVDEVELEVDIAVAEVDTSILDGAIYAAIKAAIEARNLPYIGDNGHWLLYDTDTESYVDSGVEAQGPEGDPGQTGPAGPEGSPGITSATVSVDANTGTPSVDASIVNKVLTLAFHNLKGAKGDTGATGATGATGPE